MQDWIQATGSLALDRNDDLYIADSGSVLDRANFRIRKVSTPSALKGYVGAENIVVPTDEGEGYVYTPTGLHVATIELHSAVSLATYIYDAEKRLVTIADRFGNSTAIERNGSGVVTGIRAPDGQYTALVVDDDNRLNHVIFPDGSQYSFGYDIRGQMTEEVDPNGNLYTHAFDSEGKLESVSDPEGGGLYFSQVFGVGGESTTSVVSAEGQETTHVQSTGTLNVERLSTTYPNGSVSSSITSADKSDVSRSLACGTQETVHFGLDPVFQYRFLQNSSSMMPSGLTLSLSFERTYLFDEQTVLPDVVEDKISKNGREWTIRKEIASGIVTSTSPSGRASVLMYDPATLLMQETTVPGLLPTTYGYDLRGRLTNAAVGSRSLQVGYDQNGNLDFLVTPDSKTFDYTYDVMGRLLAESRPDGSQVDYQYDPNGNLTTLVNPNAIGYSFGYTANNQRTVLAHPLSGSYQYLYDRDRRLTSVSLPSGRQIQNTYAVGVLDYTVTPEGTVDFDYACSGRLTNAVRGSESVAFTYDGSLVTSDTRSGTLAQSIGFTYNNDFAPISMSYAGATASYSYDADGLLTGAAGYTVSRDVQNGLPLSVSGNGMTQSRTFSGYGEMDASVWTAGAATPHQWNLSRDAAGRILQRTEVIDGETITWEYAYDTLGRLTEVQKNSALVESYSYDANGNRLSEMNSLRGIMDRSYTHSVEDHVITAGPDSYMFDVDGFVESKTTPEGTTVYDYSSRGELQRAELPDGRIVTYLNDPFGRRIAKQINGTTVEKYLWAGQTTLLAVFDGADNLLQRYTYADARMPVSMTAGGATYFLLVDQVGTLRAVADTSGAIVKRLDYDSFGNILSDSNPGFAVPFGFAGGLHDRGTGLVRFGFRDYDPGIGRFTAKDPIDFAGGDTNLYSYVMSDPVNLTDSSGLRVLLDKKLPSGVVDAINRVRSTPTGRTLYDILDRLPTDYRITLGDRSEYVDRWFGADEIRLALNPEYTVGYEDELGHGFCDDTSMERMIAHEFGEAFGVSIGLSDAMSHDVSIRVENSVANGLGDARTRLW